MIKIGAAKSLITSSHRGAGMMGYGMYFNFVSGVQTQLYTRAFVFQRDEDGPLFALVNAEICFISDAIKQGVIERLERDHGDLAFEDRSVMLCAQHTHSAPGGYSHYALYNFTVPGFIPEVHEAIVAAIVHAIVDAVRLRRPASIRRASANFPPEADVAFNRSLDAYNLNRDVQPLSEDKKNLAVDRRMQLIRFDDEGGVPIGAINWFGVHTTSISNDNHLIDADNKGYAASLFEERYRSKESAPPFVGAFCQSTAGDVTPNFIYDENKRWMRGKFEDDTRSARWHGEMQSNLASDLMAQARDTPEIDTDGGIDAILSYVDLSDVHCDPDLAAGQRDARTSAACIGVDMLTGTAEGPGMVRPIAMLARAASKALKFVERAGARLSTSEKHRAVEEKYRSQGNKRIVIETGKGRMLGTANIGRLPIPGLVDPAIATMKKHHRSGGLDRSPWTPKILPFQVLRLGPLALVGIPAELTTVAGRRIRQTLETELSALGIDTILITTYANAYSGYVCTEEEYGRQDYEGGHTLFGQWTLAAYRTSLRRLARRWANPDLPANPDPAPHRVDPDELRRRLHDGPFKANARALAKLIQG